LVDEDMCCYSMMILGQGRKRGVPYHYIGTWLQYKIVLYGQMSNWLWNLGIPKNDSAF
jgi:hypothetical protein